MPRSTGLDRIFGPSVQGRIQEVRRTAAVAVSDATEEATAAGAYSRRVSVLRREPDGSGSSSIGIRATWTTAPGLANLVGHVRTFGTWKDAAGGVNVVLRDGERIVLIADIPAGGDGAAYELLPTDRLQWDDPVYGAGAVFDITEVRVRKPDGLCVALTRYARED